MDIQHYYSVVSQVVTSTVGARHKHTAHRHACKKIRHFAGVPPCTYVYAYSPEHRAQIHNSTYCTSQHTSPVRDAHNTKLHICRTLFCNPAFVTLLHYPHRFFLFSAIDLCPDGILVYAYSYGDNDRPIDFICNGGNLNYAKWRWIEMVSGNGYERQLLRRIKTSKSYIYQVRHLLYQCKLWGHWFS